MSEFVSSMGAANLLADAGQVSSGTKPLASQAVATDAQELDFATLFNDLGLRAGQPKPIMLANELSASDPLLPFLLSGQLDVQQPINVLQAPIDSLPAENSDEDLAETLLTEGKELPLALPLVSVSGFTAIADQDGAAAVAFLGDDKQVLASQPQLAKAMSPAIAKSQQQLSDFLQDFEQAQLNPASTTNKADINKQLELLNSSATAQVNAASANVETASAQSVTSALPGLHSVNEFNSVLAASGRTPEALTASPNQPQWGEQVGERVHWMLSQGLRQADIRLNPPELGLLEVRIQMRGEHATIQFNTAHVEVKDALDNAMPRLREMLEQSGVNLADVNVSSQSNQQRHASEHIPLRGNRTQDDELLVDEVTPIKVSAIQDIGLLDIYA